MVIISTQVGLISDNIITLISDDSFMENMANQLALLKLLQEQEEGQLVA